MAHRHQPSTRRLSRRSQPCPLRRPPYHRPLLLLHRHALVHQRGYEHMHASTHMHASVQACVHVGHGVCLYHGLRPTAYIGLRPTAYGLWHSIWPIMYSTAYDLWSGSTGYGPRASSTGCGRWPIAMSCGMSYTRLRCAVHSSLARGCPRICMQVCAMPAPCDRSGQKRGLWPHRIVVGL